MISVQKILVLQNELDQAANEWQGDKPTSLPTSSQAMRPGVRFPKIDRATWWGRYNQKDFPSGGLIDYIRQINPKPDEIGVAVDLGCGNSLTTASLLERGWKVIFVDYSERSLELQKATLKLLSKPDQSEFVCSKAETYTFPKEIDLVIANNALTYFNPKEVPSLLRKIFEALRPGGRFVGNFWHYEERQMVAYKAMAAWVVKGSESGRLLLQSAGFDVEVCKLIQHPLDTFETLTFSAKKASEEKATNPFFQTLKFKMFTPVSDPANYWFYIAKKSLNKGKPYEGEALANLEKAEGTLGKESYQRKTVHGWTPLHVAVLAANRAAIAYFISKGIDPKTTDDEGLSAGEYAKRYNPELIELFA